MVHSTHRDEQDLFRRVGLDGRFPDRQGGDLAGLVTQNAGNNKIDVFLRRELAYRARFDPSTGAVVATATVRLHNDAPAAGLPHAVIGHAPGIDAPEGTNRTYLSFYSPLRLTKAALDGAPLDLARERELGLQVYSALVDVPAGATVTLTLQLQGAVERSHDYRLTLAAQPLVNPDRVTIDVTPAAGWQASRPGGPRLLVLREDRRVTTALTRR